MTRISLLAFFLTLLVGCAEGDKPAAKNASRPDSVRRIYLGNIARFDSALASFDRSLVALRSGGEYVEQAREKFLAARIAFKRIEFLTEFFAPTTAAGLNGPALDDVEEDDPNQVVIVPEGLQVIEASLYSDPPAAPDSIAIDLGVTRSNARRLHLLIEATTFTDANIFEAMRLEIARIVSLGLAGFDVPIVATAMPEAAAALEGVRETIAIYRQGNAAASGRALDSLLALAIADLRAHPDFVTFDRARFIRMHANPIARTLVAFRGDLGIPVAPTAGRGFHDSAATLFDRNAFDPAAFAPPYAADGNADRVALGRLLFFDPVLSGDGARSCASCHRPELGFSDGERLSRAFGSQGMLARNTPGLLNVALQNGAFYDRRVSYLEDQATAVIGSPLEMHGSLERAVDELRSSPEYAALFRRAFPRSGADPVNDLNIRIATSSYLRSLVALDAPFDRYLRGEEVTIDSATLRGFNLFMGKGRCGTCHFAPLYNGTVPPTFAESELEIIGVTESWPPSSPRLDPDLGRFGASRIELDRFAFKTPTVRNVSLTAPYMHNGAFRTLEEVIDFYDRGGALGLGLDLPTQTLPGDRLNLTPPEKSDMIAFLRALTDTVGTTVRPRSLPTIAGKSVRMVGGKY